MTESDIIVYNEAMRDSFKVLFSVSRRIGTSLESQLVGGFSRAIRSGGYVNGERLPGIRRLATAFGVSEVTVRNAVTRLCQMGLLQARPRVGLQVCAAGARSWRGTVLGIRSGSIGMFHATVMEGLLADTLRERGWLYNSVMIPSVRAAEGLDVLDQVLDPSVSLVVSLFAPAAILARLSRCGIPIVSVGASYVPVKTGFSMSLNADAALVALAGQLRSSGARSVLFAYQHPSATDFAPALRAAGLRVRPIRIRPVGGYDSPEAVQRAGLQTFWKMLSAGGVREDAVVCNDDYLSAGILSAFDRCGVRIPEDVRFATWANRHSGPVYFKNLTRIELDPVSNGRTCGESLVTFLERGVTPARTCLEACYIKGETV